MDIIEYAALIAVACEQRNISVRSGCLLARIKVLYEDGVSNETAINAIIAEFGD